MFIHNFKTRNKNRRTKFNNPQIFFNFFVLFSVAIFGFSYVNAQANDLEKESKSFYFKSFNVKHKELITINPEKYDFLLSEKENTEEETSDEETLEDQKTNFSFASQKEDFEEIKVSRILQFSDLKTAHFFTDSAENKFARVEKEVLSDEKLKSYKYVANDQYKEKFHWKPALIQSGIFLGIQHGFRLLQKKTVREFDGPFFKDWATSVKNLRGWADGDSTAINYIAHPLQGGVTGRIFINNSDHAKRQQFSKSKEYWESRFRTFIWSAVWSTQFELGPFSEATIGNVGLIERNGHSSMAWVDMVITPVVGTGVVIGEDAIDRYILKNWLERKKGGRVTPKIKILRSILTPTTTFSNILRGKYPWHRDFR